jgi:hypothetical protein
MALLAEGIWPCTVISGSFGKDDKGSPQVQINVRIDEGPSAGRQCTYEDQVNAKSALYIGRSLKACGWLGRNLDTVKADVAAWVEATGGKSTVEIRHVEIKKGKKYDAWAASGFEGPGPVWDKPNSIGRGAKPLAPAQVDLLADANDAMARALAADGGGGMDDEPPPNGDDIPFISCAMRDVSPIAKVLR